MAGTCGIYAGGEGSSITVEESYLEVTADYCTLNAERGSITLTDAVYSLWVTEYNDYVVRFSPSSSFVLPGTFRMLDISGHQIYEGVWDASLLHADKEGRKYLGVEDANGDMIEARRIQSRSFGDAKYNRIEGVKKTYVSGDTVTFEAVGSGISNDVPLKWSTRWVPTKWEMGALSGTWMKDPYTANFSTRTLAAGEYALTATFIKERYDGQAWVAMTKDGGQGLITDTKTVKFTVTEKIDDTPDATPKIETSDQPSTGTPKLKKTSEAPNTGDENGLIGWIILLLLFGGVGFTMVYDRKRY